MHAQDYALGAGEEMIVRILLEMRDSGLQWLSDRRQLSCHGWAGAGAGSLKTGNLPVLLYR